jgi:hypothetical protein
MLKIEKWGNHGIANGRVADCGTGDSIRQFLNPFILDFLNP